MLMSSVLPDRVLIGAEFIPRRLDLPSILVVPAGQTVEAAADSTFDYVEVAGTLKISRAHNTVLRCTTLIVLPDGYLDCGTQADPIPATVKVEIIIRNVPIDFTKDPFQWGNGLVNFGRQTRVGAEKLYCGELATEVQAGSTTITITEDPTGWLVGDELLLQDTRQTVFPARPRRETPVFIAGIAGRVITLSKPLDFEHLAIRRPDGSIKTQGCACNLTRNILIRSENPSDTPGHTVSIGPMTSWDNRYNELRGLGRTKNRTLDGTVLATNHIGTNIKAKYCDHFHHAQGFGSSVVGMVYRGLGIDGGFGKWGLSVHATHDTLVERCIAVDFPGAGFVTEDGYEVRNVFRKNIALYCLGNHTDDRNIEVGNAEVTDNPGGAGNGFWLRGVHQTFDGNEAWNNIIGINFFNQDQIPGLSPSVPGGPADTPFVSDTQVPILCTDNIANANTYKGFEYWKIARFPNVNLQACHNGIIEVFQAQSNLANPYLVNPTIIGVNANTVAVVAGIPYVNTLTIDGGEIRGCWQAVMGGGQVVNLSNVALQNAINLNWTDIPRATSQVNVTHEDLPGHPRQWILFGNDQFWNGTLPFPPHGGSAWIIQRGSRHTIKNWQKSGQDFQLFTKQQLGSVPAWPSTDAWPDVFNCPDAGISMAESYARYGLAYNGESVDQADTVPLDGLVTGLARVGTAPRFGPPRLVITSPTNRNVATVHPDDGNHGGPFINVYGVLTGDPSMALPIGLISVDGGVPFRVSPQSNDTVAFGTTKVSQGLHEIKAWRLDMNQTAIDPPMVFHYSVGAVVPVPVPTPVPPPVPVPVPPPVDQWVAVTPTLQRLGKTTRYRIFDGQTNPELVTK